MPIEKKLGRAKDVAVITDSSTGSVYRKSGPNGELEPFVVKLSERSYRYDLQKLQRWIDGGGAKRKAE